MPCEIRFATMTELESWMALVDLLRPLFPGLETQEKMDGYRQTVVKNINRRTALCAVDGGRVVGFLLFSTKYNLLCHLGVHPAYRRQGLAAGLIARMLPHLDRSREISVVTYREEDEKGPAPRALYRKLGFEPAELCFEFGYPEQKFILRPKVAEAR